ncbi:MAG: hypothetical protein NVSMB25_17000 [Thermoleophilaceae bacterium]
MRRLVGEQCGRAYGSIHTRRRAVVARAAIALTAAATLAAPLHASAAPAVTAPSPDRRPLTPAGTLYATQGQFPAGALLGPSGANLFVADANKTMNYVESFDATVPSKSATTVPATTMTGAEAPYSQSGQLTNGPDGQIYGAGGSTATVRAFSDLSVPVQTATYQVGALDSLSSGDKSGYIGAVAVGGTSTDPILFASEPFDKGGGKGNHVVRYDTLTRSATHTATVGTHPLAIAINPASSVVAVANQGDGTVSVLGAATLAREATVSTGRQPDVLAFSADGSRLFVVDTLDDELAVIDTSSWAVTQRLSLRGPDGGGAQPNALAVGADGTIYVSLAGENAIAVVGGPAGGSLTVQGRIPTARYPTSVAVDDSRRQIFVTAGKAGSLDTGSMPQNPGALEQIPIPDPAALAAYTSQVSASARVAPPVCSTSPLAGIQHVVYVIRENKTYDSEFGDQPGGLPAYLMYGRNTTPNTHALADRFALLENFNANEEVSDSGHQALMGSLANDWVQRFVEQSYNLGGAPRPGAELGNDDSVLWSPSNYLLDSALAAGVSFRDYGEFYRRDQATGGAVSPALDSHIVHDYPHFGFDPGYPDTGRIAFWRTQFADDVAHGTFPSLEVVYLPEDHTTTAGGAPPAQQQVADSDLATGQLVDTLSHSPYWQSSAVFMSEDDPQDGMDHVDPHRTVGFVAGPHVVPGTQTAAPYDQLGMLRTIELILGLPALTEHDATARPMLSLFDPAHADASPYAALTPNPPPASPATRRAVRALTRHDFGSHPSQSALFDRGSAQKLRIQWLSTHGHPFHPSASTPGPGSAAVRPGAAAELAGAGAAQAPASADCPQPADQIVPGVVGSALPPAGTVGPPIPVHTDPGRIGPRGPAGRARGRRHIRLKLRVRHSGRRALLIGVRAAPGARVTLRLRERGLRDLVVTRRADRTGSFNVIVRHLIQGSVRVRATIPHEPPVLRRTSLR